MNLLYVLEYLQGVAQKRLAAIEILEEQIETMKAKYEGDNNERS